MISTTLEKIFYTLFICFIKVGGEAKKIIIQADGDRVECVDIYKQPSLDHPLLKHHKVQVRPSALPIGFKRSSLSTMEGTASPVKEAACPPGTVPIYTDFGSDRIINTTMPENFSAARSHFAMVRMKPELNYIYRGVSGKVSIYGITVEDKQMSKSQVLIEGGPPGHLNQIATGVMAAPSIYPDSKSRVFVYWTVDGGNKTGCFNHFCKGYVQVHPRIGPGSAIRPVSTYGGRTHVMTHAIYEDQKTHNWWITMYDSQTWIGYYPKELFQYLNDRVTRVAWGGSAVSGRAGTSPAMGSGYKPDGNYTHAAYFSQLLYADEYFVAHSPANDAAVEDVDASGCYAVDNKRQKSPPGWNYTFLFGGPGGFCA